MVGCAKMTFEGHPAIEKRTWDWTGSPTGVNDDECVQGPFRYHNHNVMLTVPIHYDSVTEGVKG